MKMQSKNIDHLIYTVAELEAGIDEMEELLGVRAVIGGSHHLFGTHNAILSLGDFTYLEIIAPSPNLKAPKRGRWLANSFKQKSKLTTWALQTRNITELATFANKNGLTLGNIESGQRAKTDGTVLTWELTDPYTLSFDGVVPFLIDWGETKHPAKHAPKAGKLDALIIKHPYPKLVMESLKKLDIDIEVIKADQPGLQARIRTGKGIIVLD